MNDKYIIVSLMFLLFLVVAVPVISAEPITVKEDCPVWWNPFTWFGDCNIQHFEKKAQWVKVYSDDEDLYEVIPDRGKQNSNVYLCSKTATNPTQLPALDIATSSRGKAVQLTDKGRLTPINYNGAFCYKYTPTMDEKFLKFGEHSTHFVYTDESITATDDLGNEIGTLSLITDNYDYKNGKPNINLGFGDGLLTHVFQVSNYTDGAITNLRAVDMNSGLEVERNLQIKYLTYELYDVDTYDLVCSWNESSQNETCSYEVNGTREESREKWLDFVGVEGEDYTLGIFADVKNKDYIDIDFDYYGISVMNSPINWATWSADLNTNLVAYYKFDTNYNDSHSTHHATASNNPPFVAGIINNGTSFTSANAQKVTIPYTSDFAFDTGDFAFNFWYKASADTHLFSTQNLNPYPGMSLSLASGGIHVRFSSGSGTQLTASNYLGAGWQMMTLQRSGTNASLWINGTYVGSTSTSANVTGTDWTFAWIKWNDPTYYTNSIDEVSIYKGRALTSDEISQYWNSGSGITYTSGGTDNPPTATLVSPVNNTNYTASSLIVNTTCSASDDIDLVNVSLYINGVLNQSNSSGLNNTNYTFATTLGNGTYNWSCLAYDNSSQSGTSDTNIFTVKNMIISLDSPADSLLTQDTSLIFNYTVTNQSVKFLNTTLYLDGVINASNTTYTDGYYRFNVTGLSTGSHNWTVTAYDNTGTSYATSTRSFIIANMDITLVSPAAYYNDSTGSISFATYIDSSEINIDNVSLYINGVINQTNSSGVNGNYTFPVTGLGAGTYNWTIRVTDNESVNYDSSTRTFFVYNMVTLNDPTDGEVSVPSTILFNSTATTRDQRYFTGSNFYSNVSGSWALVDSATTFNPYDATLRENGVTAKANLTFIFNESSAVSNVSFWGYSGRDIGEAQFIVQFRYANGTFINSSQQTTTSLTAIPLTFTPTYTNELISGVDVLYGGSGGVASALFKNTTVYRKPRTITSFFSDTVAGPTLWNVEYCLNDSSCTFAPSNYTVSIDTIAPIVTLTEPLTSYDSLTVGEALNINWTAQDSNLDSCWYSYNGVNTTVTCNDNHTTFNYSLDANTLTFYANDTGGNIASETNTWVYRTVLIQETYATATTSGATNTFSIDYQTNGTQITLAYLIYNGTSYLGSISSTGDIYNISRTLTIPAVTTSTNLPFYWNITMEDAYTFASTEHNQTVGPLVIGTNCTAGNYTLFNLTLADEKAQTKINETALDSLIEVDLTIYSSARTTTFSTFYQQFSQINPVAVCINNNLSNSETYSVDMQIKYGAYGYSTEYYNIERFVLNSSTMNYNLTLYDLDNTSTQEFKLLARDSSYLPMTGALIQIERKYITNGSFYIVEVPKTGETGTASASLEVNDVIYNFKIYKNGVLVSQSTNVQAICQTPLVSTCEIDFNAYQEGLTLPDFESGDDFDFNIAYNKTSRRLSAQYVIPSGEPSTVKLEVVTNDVLGSDICTEEIYSSGGYLYCTIGESYGNSSVTAKLFKDDVQQGFGNVKLSDGPQQVYGVILVILSMMVLLTLVGIGVSDSPVISIVFVVVGVIFMISINLIESTGFIGASATFLFLAIAVIIFIIKAGRRT